MDDVKLLKLTALSAARHHSPSSTIKRTKLKTVSVWTGQDRDTISRQQSEDQNVHESTRQQTLALNSISKGGLPAVDAKTRTKFYQMMSRSSGKDSSLGASSPGKKKLSKNSESSRTMPSSNSVSNQHHALITRTSSTAKTSNNQTGAAPLPLSLSLSATDLGRAAKANTSQRPSSMQIRSPSKSSSKNAHEKRPATAVTSPTPSSPPLSPSGSEQNTRGKHKAVPTSTATQNNRPKTNRDMKITASGVVQYDGPDPESFARRTQSSMTRLQTALQQQHSQSRSSESLSRLQLMQHGDALMLNLPLAYLASRTELRHYAVEKCGAVVFQLCMKRVTLLCRQAFGIWKAPPVIVMNEMQVGFMVIAKRLESLLKRVLGVRFDHWSRLHSIRFSALRDTFRNKACAEIQRWYRLCRVYRREPYKRLLNAITVCLQRRKAIKFTIDFELNRRKAYMKILRTVITRRRKFFAARSIMRVKRWAQLNRKMTWKLTRHISIRSIQRWWRMVQCRPEKERELIRFVVRMGGITAVKPRVLHADRNKVASKRFLRDGFLQSMNNLASMLQRAWLTSKGQLALFMLFAARRAKEEYEKMLNDNATVIQQNWRAYLWTKLCKVAIIWNRARRIQRGYRASKYREWTHQRMLYRYQRHVRFIQRCVRRWITRRILAYRFKARKAVLIFTRAKKSLSCNMIQRCFRAYKERERIRKEMLVAMITSMRNQAELVVKCVSKIQRNWRQFKNLDRKGNGKNFPKHVYMIIEKYVRKAKLRLHEMAKRIQRRAKIFIPLQAHRRLKLRIKKANVIWRMAKSYLLKQALWDRVEARRLLQKNASNTMRRNLRKLLFRRRIELRGRLRGVQKAHKKLLNDHAAYIQRWIRRKRTEYWVLPVRKAARIHVRKRRELEVERRQNAMINKAAFTLARFFRPFPIWARFLPRVEQERLYYIRRIAAKKMQRFARSLIAWARFDRVVAYRRKCVYLSGIDPFLTTAVNIIGHYWKRYKEKSTLSHRFVLRAKMMVEWKRLEANRLLAIEEKRIAEEDKRRTDENMAATIKASWKQGADERGRNYFYNYVTGETSWDAPEDWKGPVTDMWMRQTDEKGNVYYYNMKSGESQWLPPCSICGELGERYCADCTVAYCEADYERYHSGELAETEDLKDHKWSLTEYAMDILKPGEQYCVECRKRVAELTCMTCWDNYCKVCFNFTHHTGALKYHKAQTYHRARKGWSVKKGTLAGELDFYVNGTTGETTYEKPEELMTPEELMYFTNFKSHEKAALEHIEKIKTLQFDIEAIAYERDTIVQRALETGTNIGDILAKRKKKNPNRFAKDADTTNVIAEVAKKTRPGYKLFSSSFAEYRQNLLNPKPRARGQEKAAFISKLLNEGSPPKK